MKFGARVEEAFENSKAGLRHNVTWGLIYGCIAALVLSVFACILAIRPGTRAFEEAGVTLGQVLIIYTLGGLAGGIILGVCRPLLPKLLGRLVTGFLVVFPAVMLIEWMTEPRPLADLIKNAAIIATFLGPMYAVGWQLYEKYLDKYFRTDVM
jgi:hypothetical protein